MRLSRMLLAAAMAAVSTAALAASPFAGTWKTDLKSAAFNPRPDVMVLTGGNFNCKSCIPPVTVPADGNWHAVKGHDYYDEIMVNIDGPRAVTVSRRKGGKPTSVSTETASADGQTLMIAYHDHSSPNGEVVDSTVTQVRIGRLPIGAHVTSGSWRTTKVATASDAALTWTFADRPGGLGFADQTGTSFEARFGGPAVPLKGDNGGTMVSIKQVSPRVMVETDTRAGKVVSVSTSTVSLDGKTLTIDNEDRRAGGKSRFTATRQ